MANKSGKIITFYSYKGGTGRTMAVANVGWILASNGYDVLLVDWDLEAPGLHRYLRPFLIDSELSSTPGLIDFVWEAVRVSMTPAVEHDAPIAPNFPSLDDYAVALDWDFHDRGSISFVSAGRQDENYAQRVNTFNWDDFYRRFGGGKLLQAERDSLRQKYDYILIDSRTGVSDTSGICTVQMPDVLVVLFTLNRQSIKGAAAATASIDATVRTQRGNSMPIYPVPTRIENAETTRRDAAIAYARRAFAPLLTSRGDIGPDQQASYWNDVETPYVQFYAFEEVPAAFHEEAGSTGGVLRPNERIASWITEQLVSSLRPESDERRKDIVAAYALTEDDVPQIDWGPQLQKRGVIHNLSIRPRRHLGRHGWQYATLAFAGLCTVAASQWYSTETRLEEMETTLQSTLGTLESTRDTLQSTQDKLQSTQDTIQSTQDKPESTRDTLQDQALSKYNEAIFRNPHDPDLYYNRGQAFAKQRKFALAAEDFGRAIQLKPNDAEALNNRCFTRAVIGQLDAALSDCNEALKLNPKYVDAFDSRGLTHLKLGQFDRAIADYDAALRLNPKLASALYGRGKAKIKKGDAAGGNADIRHAKSIDSTIDREFEGYAGRGQ